MNGMRLRVGDFGDEVASLHDRLKEYGLPISPDEQKRRFFGPSTRMAVSRFQATQGIDPTGEICACAVTNLAVTDGTGTTEAGWARSASQAGASNGARETVSSTEQMGRGNVQRIETTRPGAGGTCGCHTTAARWILGSQAGWRPVAAARESGGGGDGDTRCLPGCGECYPYGDPSVPGSGYRVCWRPDCSRDREPCNYVPPPPPPPPPGLLSISYFSVWVTTHGFCSNLDTGIYELHPGSNFITASWEYQCGSDPRWPCGVRLSALKTFGPFPPAQSVTLDDPIAPSCFTTNVSSPYQDGMRVTLTVSNATESVSKVRYLSM